MALLPNIVFVVFVLCDVEFSLGLVEGTRGVTWNAGVGIENPGRIMGDLGGDIINGAEGFAKRAEHIAEGIERGAEKIGAEVIGDIEKGAENIAKAIEHGMKEMESGIKENIAKGAGELAEEVGKGVADLGEGIENGAEGLIDGAKGAIDGIGGIVGKFSPHKNKNHDKDNHDESNEHERHHHDEDRHNHHHRKHNKDDSHEKKHHMGDDSHEKHLNDKNHHGNSNEHRGHHDNDGDRHNHHHRRHHTDDGHEKKHHKGDDSHENKHHKGDDSHEKHHDDKKARKHHHDRHTGRGIDRKTGIGSRDGIRTPILDLLGLTQSICRVSYAAENIIEDLGELHIWADKQMGMAEHAAVNYLIDNLVLKAVDGARKYHHKIINFVIDTHIGIQKLVMNSIIEAYRVSKAPIRELLAC